MKNAQHLPGEIVRFAEAGYRHELSIIVSSDKIRVVPAPINLAYQVTYLCKESFDNFDMFINDWYFERIP